MKMAIKDIAKGRSDLYKVDPAIIQMKDDWNSRDAADPANKDHIAMLKASIKEMGVKKPLVCYQEKDGIVYVTDGHCRLTAVRELIAEGVEIKLVPVMVEDKLSNEADRIFSQIVHNAGKPLTVIEQGRVFKRLIALGWDQTGIATKAGITQSRVSQVLKLQTLPEKLQRYIVDGKVAATLVLELWKKHNEDVDKVIAELEGALANAEAAGRKKVLPKDTGGEGEGGGEGKSRNPSLKSLLKDIIERAWAEGLVDESEDKVTMTWSDDEYAMVVKLLDI
jgi:ParB/RepB/Spo0J family partition protein